MKRLIICCDGTWNTPDQTDGGVPTPTNVVRLYNAILKEGEKDKPPQGQGVENPQQPDPTKQKAYYHPGVGTDPGLWSKLAGGGLGKGLDRNIMSGYRYLADNYEAGDDLYFFGFSRGAYTVRSLVGMIGCCGILDTSGLAEAEIWGRIEAVYTEGYRKRRGFTGDNWAFLVAPDSDKKDLIRFLGVWDTVGALGIPDDMGLLNLLDRRHDYTFHDTDLGDTVTTARHAVAIDERRATFQPTLWTNAKIPDVKQIWFPGVHSDVGGGYAETGLSDGALKWMIEEAERTGLRFKVAAKNQIAVSHHGVLHDSLSGVFGLLPTMPRSVPCFEGDKQAFHPSALSRYDDPPITQSPYRPTMRLEPGESAVRDIFAVEPWNDTGLFLDEGVTYRLEAAGEWVDKSVTCGPDGADDGKFQIGEVAHLVGSAIGQVEELFKWVGGNENANFIMTRRHEKYPWFSLVGAIANSIGVDPDERTVMHETNKIGSGITWTPQKSGYLYAYANDAWRFYDNNKGRVRLTVTRN